MLYDKNFNPVKIVYVVRFDVSDYFITTRGIRFSVADKENTISKLYINENGENVSPEDLYVVCNECREYKHVSECFVDEVFHPTCTNCINEYNYYLSRRAVRVSEIL